MQFIKPSFRILERFYGNPSQNLKLLLSRHLEGLPDMNQRHAVSRTVYGVVRMERQLDYIISRYSARKLKKIQPDVLMMLRVGVYLLIYSSSYPAYAVVNEVVAAARKNVRRFVNALLRAVTGDENAIRQSLQQLRETQPLGTVYSVSEFLVEQLEQISTELEKDLEYLNREPRFHLRINTGTSDFGTVKKRLQENDVNFKELETFQCLEVKETGPVIRRLLEEYRGYFQNTGSQAVSIIASHFAGKTAMDCCAAPGTKSVTLSMMKPGLTIIANDIHPGRVSLMIGFLQHYRLDRIRPMVSDAARPAVKPAADVDFVIVDAPCTSAGTLRKNPDLKLKIDRNAVERNAEIQYRMMTALLERLEKTRYFLYSVCSFTADETENVMDRVISKSPGGASLSPVDLSEILDRYRFRYKKGKHGYFLLPSESLNNDLFYLSLLQKSSVQ
jgi:16S rRNA (cytosine967-C5)-methyltransferase